MGSRGQTLSSPRSWAQVLQDCYFSLFIGFSRVTRELVGLVLTHALVLSLVSLCVFACPHSPTQAKLGPGS